MLMAGKALKVSIYLHEGSRHHGVASDAAILDYLFFHGVAGALVLKGVAGFGAEHHLHSASLVELSDRLPVKVEFVAVSYTHLDVYKRQGVEGVDLFA